VGGGAAATPIPVTRAHPVVPSPAPAAVAPAASKVPTAAGGAGRGVSTSAATERAAITPPAPASSPEAKTIAAKPGERAPRSSEAATAAHGKGGKGGPYREPAAPAPAAEAPAAAAAPKGPGPVTQAWAGSPAAGQPAPKKSLARRLLPAAAVGGTLVGIGGTAATAGYGLNRLQRAQEETSGAPPIAPPAFVGQGRVA
jgi:hypothetical protein